MQMKEREILQALQSATIQAVNACIDPTIPVKYIGRTFKVPSDDKWLEVVQIPNNVTNEFWGKEKTYRGLYRLLLHWPLIDEGAYPPIDLLASICSYFVKGVTFQSDGVSVKVQEEPDLTGVIESPPELLFPVTIRYLSFQH